MNIVLFAYLILSVNFLIRAGESAARDNRGRTRLFLAASAVTLLVTVLQAADNIKTVNDAHLAAKMQGVTITVSQWGVTIKAKPCDVKLDLEIDASRPVLVLPSSGQPITPRMLDEICP